MYFGGFNDFGHSIIYPIDGEDRFVFLKSLTSKGNGDENYDLMVT
jgi:hypothetical protein